jgi:hypothetical protein
MRRRRRESRRSTQRQWFWLRHALEDVRSGMRTQENDCVSPFDDRSRQQSPAAVPTHFVFSCAFEPLRLCVHFPPVTNAKEKRKVAKTQRRQKQAAQKDH